MFPRLLALLLACGSTAARNGHQLALETACAAVCELSRAQRGVAAGSSSSSGGNSAMQHILEFLHGEIEYLGRLSWQTLLLSPSKCAEEEEEDSGAVSHAVCALAMVVALYRYASSARTMFLCGGFGLGVIAQEVSHDVGCGEGAPVAMK